MFIGEQTKRDVVSLLMSEVTLFYATDKLYAEEKAGRVKRSIR
jgi:hypothetical protein